MAQVAFAPCRDSQRAADHARSARGALIRVVTSGVAMRSLVLLAVLALGAVTAPAGAVAEINPVRTHPHAAPASMAAQFIIKLRAVPAGAAVPQARQRVAEIAGRAGLALRAQRPITSSMYVLRVEPAAGESAAATLARLRADPDLEYAELDQRRYVHAVTPNDPLFTQQWYLQISTSTPSAIDAVDAWSITTGSSATVIADIDTGVRADHPDLAARLLPGYCFISDPFVANVGTSGSTCPGPGAVDPGDWITQQDIDSSPNGECSNETSPEPSSWHGTRVAGILGAATNNSVGVAGVTWNAQLLPVRALGTCGGIDSDIISGMLWAAGIAVSGAPLNPNPAKIINLSLGGTGSCPNSYQDAIDQISALGVLIVVSAGNEGGPVDTPANCSGVAGVTGLRQAGTKVGYSSLGPQIALAAPAGNCSNAFTGLLGSPCVYSMTTTTNLGYQQPDANDYTGEYYCDPTTGSDSPLCTLANSNQYRTYNIGTSFSAPVVSGIAALMSAVNSKLNSCQMIARLKQSATPFPQKSLDAVAGQPPMCHVPANASDVQDAECICTQDGQTCGAGMANAPAALSAALRPIAAVALPAGVSSGATLVLDGSGSAAANGHNIVSYQWSAAPGGLSLPITGASSSKAGVTAPACGIGTVQLTVTDDAGRTDTADVIITPSSVTTSAPPQAGDGFCPLGAPQVQLAVCPANASVQAGVGSQSFTATLANTSDTAVTWEVDGIVGGSATLGTISSSGVYTPPASPPASPTVTVAAVSAADGSVSGSASVAISAAPSSGHGGGGAGDLLTLVLGASLLLARQRRSS
jgi:serine protease